MNNGDEQILITEGTPDATHATIFISQLDWNYSSNAIIAQLSADDGLTRQYLISDLNVQSEKNSSYLPKVGDTLTVSSKMIGLPQQSRFYSCEQD